MPRNIDDYEYDESDLEFDSDFVSEGDENTSVQSIASEPLVYRTVSFAQVQEALRSLVQRTADMTGLPYGTAFLLLNAYDWDLGESVSACLENSPAAAQKMGLDSITSAARPPRIPKLCPVCFEPIAESFGLKCGHRTCVNCFKEYTRVNLEDRNILRLRCPGDAKCRELVRREDIEQLAAELLPQYDTLMTRAYIDRQPHKFRHCPAPRCDYIITRIEDRADIHIGGVTCLCGSMFCFECGLPCNHYAVPCDIACEWLAIADRELRSAQWIAENTKKCPKCNSTIERAEGCNHMQCEQCKHEFCWLCYRDWSEHTGNSYYECSFKSQKPSEKMGASKLSKKQLERLSHCLSEFDHHAAKALQQENGDKGLREVHNLLAWTYALLYIVTKSNSRLILEELAEAMNREVKTNSPHLQQRFKSLADFVTNGETKWDVDPNLRLRLDT